VNWLLWRLYKNLNLKVLENNSVLAAMNTEQRFIRYSVLNVRMLLITTKLFN
jgi:hypothetical protein